MLEEQTSTQFLWNSSAIVVRDTFPIKMREVHKRKEFGGWRVIFWK